LDIESADNKPCERITINHIFSDNHDWDVYELRHRMELGDVGVKEARKMLECEKGSKLFRVKTWMRMKYLHIPDRPAHRWCLLPLEPARV
jgi:hypothetical protein